ncbi:MurR/RpiR family transcriptional regulator [Variovorax paradoxus]|uniref:MurR/RpiR family transcriptional regulator n=1 Tax=Variovorax paradoxus TaxID=34073 RepID=UPI0019320608|nr:MurR/RpiR family transcriptional regulator [Variovorax paradoxus]
MNRNISLLQRVAAARDTASPSRRTILAAIVEDPDRVLRENFKQLAEYTGSSVPTIMRICRDLGFAGLREFKLALAQELAIGASPLHRRVSIDDSATDVVNNVVRSASASVAGVRNQIDLDTLAAAAQAIAVSPHIDIVGVGNTSWFMASDLQARLFRLGLSASAWADYHLQQVAAGAQQRGGVVIAISYVGGMPTLIDAVDIARAQGARLVALTRPNTALAKRADWLLGLTVPDDSVMHVGIDVYLVHLTVIEILTVLVAQFVGEPAVQRLRGVREALRRQGVDTRSHPLQSWENGETES